MIEKINATIKPMHNQHQQNQQLINLYVQHIYKLYWQMLWLQYLQTLTQNQQTSTEPNPSSVISPQSSEPQSLSPVIGKFNTFAYDIQGRTVTKTGSSLIGYQELDKIANGFMMKMAI